MDIWIIGSFSLLIVLFYIVTFNYRRKERVSLDRNKHRFLCVYGMAMFIADRVLRKILFKRNDSINLKFKKLYIKEKAEKEEYLYIVSKLALAIVIIFISNIFGMFVELSQRNNSDEIKYLERNEQGAGEIIYSLEVEKENEKETIEIMVPQREYSEEEAINLMQGYREELINTFLGENESQDRVTKPLNFINSIGKENIQIVWNVEDSDIIQYDGTLGKNISDEGIVTKVYALMSVKNIKLEQEIVISVFPQEKGENTQQIIQSIVNASDNTKKEIELPSEVEEEKITFHQKQENSGLYFGPLGVFAAIAIFILKDRDIDKEIKKRNRQMLADYSEVVSKIMLLNKAGLSMVKAWEKVVDSSGTKKEHYIYREMKLTLAKINGGISEGEAYEQFGKRCGIHCYIRFTNIINQNLKRGSNELCKALKIELDNALQERKNNALKLGEEAGTKLLAPMTIMLIVGLALIVVPAFMSVKIN